jgi:hypothetical protein
MVHTQNGSDFAAPQDQTFGPANFSLKLGAQSANDSGQLGPIAVGRFRRCELRPRVGKRRRNGLRRNKELCVERDLPGILGVSLPKAQGRRKPDACRGTTTPPRWLPQPISVLKPARESIEYFLRR